MKVSMATLTAGPRGSLGEEAGKHCPPCMQDCEQGRRCPARPRNPPQDSVLQREKLHRVRLTPFGTLPWDHAAGECP